MRWGFSKKISLIIYFVVLVVGIISIPVTFSMYSSNAAGNSDVSIARWNFKINGEKSSLFISLEDTLISNAFSSHGGKVIPGSEGIIDLNIDFSDTDVASRYIISIDNDNSSVPANLRFYTDSSYTQLFTDFDESLEVKDLEVVNKKIYWKWFYTEDDENDWADKELILKLSASANQVLEGD